MLKLNQERKNFLWIVKCLPLLMLILSQATLMVTKEAKLRQMAEATAANNHLVGIQTSPVAIKLTAEGKYGLFYESSGTHADGEGSDIFRQIFNADGTLDGVETIMHTKTGEQKYPRAASCDGRLYVYAWDDGSQIIKMAARDYGNLDSVVMEPVALNTVAIVNTNVDFDIYCDSERIIVIWADKDATNQLIVGKEIPITFAADSYTFGDPVELTIFSGVDASTDYTYRYPEITKISTGYLVVWVLVDTSSITHLLKGIILDSTTLNPGTVFIISDALSNIYYTARRIAVMNDGSYVIVYTVNESVDLIKGKIYGVDDVEGSELTFTPTVTFPEQNFSPAVIPMTGGFLLTFGNYNNSNFSIYGQMFTYTGTGEAASIIAYSGTETTTDKQAPYPLRLTGKYAVFWVETTADATNVQDIMTSGLIATWQDICADITLTHLVGSTTDIVFPDANIAANSYYPEPKLKVKITGTLSFGTINVKSTSAVYVMSEEVDLDDLEFVAGDVAGTNSLTLIVPEDQSCEHLLTIVICYESCLSCTEAGTSEDHKCDSCIQAPTPYYPLEGNTSQCYASDDIINTGGYYFEVDIFNLCSTPLPNCSACSDAMTCTDCADGYIEVSGVCEVDCYQDCDTCTIAGTLENMNCDSCIQTPTPYYPLEDMPSQCFASDDTINTVGYYLDVDVFKVCPALPNCSACSDATTCDVCEDGYGKVGSECVECYLSCGTCTEVGTSEEEMKCDGCLITSAYYPLEGNTSQCYLETDAATDGYYLEADTFKSCPENCLTCSSLSVCLTCPSDFILNTTTDQCEEANECPSSGITITFSVVSVDPKYLIETETSSGDEFSFTLTLNQNIDESDPASTVKEVYFVKDEEKVPLDIESTSCKDLTLSYTGIVPAGKYDLFIVDGNDKEIGYTLLICGDCTTPESCLCGENYIKIAFTLLISFILLIFS